MSQKTYIARKGEDADFAALTATSLSATTVTGTTVSGKSPIVNISADGAIAVPTSDTVYFFTKAGVAAMTLVDPTATTHDGITLTFIATTAQANTISNAAGGAGKDVATFGGAIGDGFAITAYQGKWYVDPRGVTNITLG
jgi:exosome complex RNA-binding protein Rrp42 (RNase PH superfamily)